MTKGWSGTRLDKGQKPADHFLGCVEVNEGWFFDESALQDPICVFFRFLRTFHCFYAAWWENQNPSRFEGRDNIPSEKIRARSGNKKGVGCEGRQEQVFSAQTRDYWERCVDCRSPCPSGRTGKKTRSKDHVSTGPRRSPRGRSMDHHADLGSSLFSSLPCLVASLLLRPSPKRTCSFR